MCPACKDDRVYARMDHHLTIQFCSYCKHEVGESMTRKAFRNIVGVFLTSKENRDYVRKLLQNYQE